MKEKVKNKFVQESKKLSNRFRGIRLLKRDLGDDFWVAGGFYSNIARMCFWNVNEVKKFGSIKPNSFVSRLLSTKDIDTYFPSKKTKEEAIDLLVGHTNFHLSKNEEYHAILKQYMPDISETLYWDLIHLDDYENLESTLSSFDFTVVSYGFNPVKDKVMFSDWFFEDNKSKTLRVKSFKRPARLVHRLSKYKSKGYEIPENTLKFCFMMLIKKLENLNSVEVLKEFVNTYKPMNRSTLYFSNKTLKLIEEIEEIYDKGIKEAPQRGRQPDSPR